MWELMRSQSWHSQSSRVVGPPDHRKSSRVPRAFGLLSPRVAEASQDLAVTVNRGTLL